MQVPRELGSSVSALGRMTTLDPTALIEQSQIPVSSDPEGDQNLRIIDAQERRLQAMNDREAAAFAAQMRQTESEDSMMAKAARMTSDDVPASQSVESSQSSQTTSNSTEQSARD